MYSELQREIEYLGNVIVEIQRQEQNPRDLTPDICATYELALHYKQQLYESDSAKLRDAHHEDYLLLRPQASSLPAKSRWECSTWP